MGQLGAVLSLRAVQSWSLKLMCFEQYRILQLLQMAGSRSFSVHPGCMHTLASLCWACIVYSAKPFELKRQNKEKKSEEGAFLADLLISHGDGQTSYWSYELGEPEQRFSPKHVRKILHADSTKMRSLLCHFFFLWAR